MGRVGGVGDAAAIGMVRSRGGDDRVLGVVAERRDIEGLCFFSHDSPQSLMRTRHREVARMNESTDDPIQNQITVEKS